MASRSERRAALAATYGRSASADDNETTTEEPTMKIRYVSVFLRDETPRLDGAKGVTASSTTLFDTTKMKDLWIELDTASGICTLSQRGNVWNIPRESVQRFGPTIEEYAAYQKSVAETAENTRRANERAAVEAAEIAARPA